MFKSVRKLISFIKKNSHQYKSAFKSEIHCQISSSIIKTYTTYQNGKSGVLVPGTSFHCMFVHRASPELWAPRRPQPLCVSISFYSTWQSSCVRLPRVSPSHRSPLCKSQVFIRFLLLFSSIMCCLIYQYMYYAFAIILHVCWFLDIIHILLCNFDLSFVLNVKKVSNIYMWHSTICKWI